ncbi:MAG: acetate/propionate family kinase [Proteobacteria bacterium]|nr:acetate/propionate family kinase [Pseudomonadota bacterium]
MILTLNTGSSSIKFALFDGDAVRAAGQVDAIGVAPELRLDGAAPQPLAAASTHADALAAILAALQPLGIERVRAVGHRIVHGGTRFDGPALIDAEVLAAIEALLPLAPLHQPHGLAGIRAASAALPGLPQVACFDTAFHRTMPDVNQRFALPAALFARGFRRYGFHGLSYESIAAQFAAAAPALARGRVVVAHLGNGASMCGMADGRSVATTMSFSPLDGLPSGTRCGRIDAAVALHLIAREGCSAAEVEDLLTRRSGWLGMSGLTSDMRTLLASEAPAAKLTIDYLVEQILRELAGLAAALRGLDALVFTGGIGENAAVLRARVLEGAAWLGLRLDAPANEAKRPERISRADSAVAAWVLRTDEERVIAQHTAALVPATS